MDGIVHLLAVGPADVDVARGGTHGAIGVGLDEGSARPGVEVRVTAQLQRLLGLLLHVGRVEVGDRHGHHLVARDHGGHLLEHVLHGEDELVFAGGRVDVELQGHAVHLHGTVADLVRVLLVARDEAVGTAEHAVLAHEDFGIATDEDLGHD